MRIINGVATKKVLFRVNRSYVIKAIAYAVWTKSLSGEINKSALIKLIDDHLYWYGRIGWTGATDIHQTVGSDENGSFERADEEAIGLVDKFFPELK